MYVHVQRMYVHVHTYNPLEKKGWILVLTVLLYKSKWSNRDQS